MAKSVYEIIIGLQGLPQTREGLEEADRQVRLLSTASGVLTQRLGQAAEAMAAFGARAAKANLDMERGVSNYKAILGITSEEASAYNKSLDAVLERTGWQISANDALKASYDAASAGYTDADDALGVLEASMNTAIAGTDGLQDSSAALRDSQLAVMAVLKNYGSELAKYGDIASQATRVSDVLYSVIKKGITDIGQLAPEFAKIAPQAASVGLSLEELAATYATVTSKTVSTNEVTTQLSGIFAALATGPSKEGAAMLEEAGVQFDIASLRAKGLVGVLEDLKAGGIDTLDKLVVITGRKEPAILLANLMADLDKTKATFAEFADELDSSRAAAIERTNDRMGALTKATNKFERELGLAGDAVVPFTGYMLEMGAAVLEAFNGAPEAVRDFAGALVTVTPILTSTSAGAMQLAADISIVSIALKSVGGVGAVMAAAKAKVAGAAAAAAGATTVLGAMTGAAIAGAAALGILAIKHRQAILTQQEQADKLGDFQSTEVLVVKVSALVNKYRELGQAIPADEYEQWKALLEQANEGNGTLTTTIKALTATQGTLLEKQMEASAAQKEARGATAELAAGLDAEVKARDTATAAMERYRQELGTLDDALKTVETGTRRAIAEGQLTATEAYRMELEALQLHAQTTDVVYRKMVAQDETLAAERARVANTSAQRMLDVRDRYMEELKRYHQLESEAELAAFDAKAATERWSSERILQERTTLLNRQLQATEANLVAELATVKKGTTKAAELYLELYRVRAQIAGNQRTLDESIEAALEKSRKAREEQVTKAAKDAKEAAEKTAKATKDAADARKKAFDQETKDYVAALNLRVAAATRAADRIQAANQFQGTLTGIASGQLGTVANLSTAANTNKTQITELRGQLAATSEPEERAKINEQLKEQLKLSKLLKTEQSTAVGLLQAMGVSVGNLGTQESAALSIAEARLQLESRQIFLKLESEKVALRLKDLELQRLQMELQRQALAEDLSATERANIAQQISLIGEQRQALEQAAGAADRVASNQLAANASASRSALAAQGVDPKQLGAEFLKASQVTALSITQVGGDTVAAIDAAAASVGPVLETGLVHVANAAASQAQTLNSTVASSGGDTVAAIVAQTTALQGSLGRVEAQVARLPAAIAASLPRPAPVPRR